MRTKKTLLNILCDTIPYVLIGIVGLVKVNFLIKYIGDVGNGYYQVINQIITYVFLAQIGFPEAVVYALYKPFAKQNKDDINSIYSGSRKICKIIGTVILGLIFIVSLCLYLFYGFVDGYRNSALICFVVIATSYLISFFGRGQTYFAVLSANQEKFVYSLTTNLVKLACDISIIFAVCIFKNLESIAVVILFAKIIEEIILRIVVKKRYPWLHEVANKNTSMIKMTKDLAWTNIGFLVLNNIDSLIIVSYMGPAMVSVYTSYNFISRYLNEIASRIELGAVYSFGNVFAKDEDDKIYPLFKEFLVLFIIIAFSVALTFMLGIRGFVSVWVDSTGDVNYLLNYITVVFFSLSLFLNISYYPLLALINARGLFNDNKKHTFICAFVNVFFSLLLAKDFGISGVLFATSLSFIVNVFLKTQLVCKKILKEVTHVKLLSVYVLMLGVYIVLTFLLKGVEALVLKYTTSLVVCILMLGIIFICTFGICFGIMYLLTPDTKKLYNRITNLLKRKFGKKLAV